MSDTNSQGVEVYKRLLGYTKRHWIFLAIAIIAMFFQAGAEPAFAWLLKILIDGSFVEQDPEIQKLAPFGRGNPLPTFLSRRVEVIEGRTMGSNGEHLRLKLKQDGTAWAGVGFGLGSYLPEISSTIDIVYNLEIDRWGGEETLRLNILDFTPAR